MYVQSSTSDLMSWAGGSVALHERRGPVRKSAIVFFLIKKPTIVRCGEQVTVAWCGVGPTRPPWRPTATTQLFGLLLTVAARRHCPSSFPAVLSDCLSRNGNTSPPLPSRPRKKQGRRPAGHRCASAAGIRPPLRPPVLRCRQRR